eukprot:jgi/Botrbrau1/16726/Bobra.0276s0006.1
MAMIDNKNLAWRQNQQPQNEADMQAILFEPYVLAYGGTSWEPEEAEAIQRVKEYITSSESSASVCLICLETMGNADAVWHCHESCHCLFHLLCIQAWGRQQLQAAQLRADATAAITASQGPAFESRPVPEVVWGCPKCRCEYNAGQLPTEYRCMCGKEVNPPLNPWLLPHTCGESCGRPLRSACGHNCLLLCHPGPCPPCPLQVDMACYCGKKVERRRCRGGTSWSCGCLCGRRMECGHRCPLRCHSGDCPPCSLAGKHVCECGSEERTVACSQRVFQCGRVCGKELPCGRHKCERVCHSGACGDCPLSAARTCPCGKVTYSALKCDELAAPCGGTCGKTLACGLHMCEERCHAGPCTSNCRAMITKTCVCGKTSKTVPCAETLRCDKKCTQMRNCGRHACKRRCCEGSCPPCEAVCGRKLPCGNHLCPAPCHPGRCLPCPLTAECSCACGATRYALPCGSESRALPPRCRHTCPVPRTCRHAAHLPPHGCHFGACPACPYPCGSSLACGHGCSEAQCHDPPATAIAGFAVPAPPVSANFASARKAAASLPRLPPAQLVAEEVRSRSENLTECPPCRVAVPVTCLGAHMTQQLPCSSARVFSCGAACGRLLACGNHSCQKACHSLPPDGECERCERMCEREWECGHKCQLACHPGPCPPCQEAVTCGCFCARSSLTVTCCLLREAAGTAKEALLLRCDKKCHKALPWCPHVCQAQCHAGPCQEAADCREEVVVRCACRRQKAKWMCCDVRRELSARGGKAEYDASTALRLLACNADCASTRESKARAGNSQGLQLDKDVARADMQLLASEQTSAVSHEPVEKRRPRTREERRQRELERESEQAKARRNQIWRERITAGKKMLRKLGIFVLLVCFVCLFLRLVWPSPQQKRPVPA